MGPTGTLTLQAWRAFEAEYRLYRSAVSDRSPGEEWRMIVTKLPPAWQEKVVVEQAKLREKKPWVRITCPPRASTDLVMESVELRTQGEIPSYYECSGGFVFKTCTTEDRDRLLGLHNALVDGVPLTASTHEYEMTADEIFAYVAKKLRVEEDVAAVRGQTNQAEPATVRAVEENLATMHVVQTGPNPNQVRWGMAKPGNANPNDNECRTCRLAGREFVHDFRQCPHFKEAAAALAARNPGVAPRECRHCKRAGRPANHSYWKCKPAQAERRRREEAAAKKAAGAAPPAPKQ